MILASAWLHEKTLPLMVAGTVVAGLAGPTAYSLTTVQSGHTGSLVTAGPSTGGMGSGMGGRPGGGGGGQGGPGGMTGQNTHGDQAANGAAQGGAPSQSTQNQTTQGTQSQSNQSTTGDGGTTSGGASRGGGGMGSMFDATTPNTQVITALSSNAPSYTWVAAAVGSQSAAGLQLGTGHAVMALGGFNGTDPSPTLAQFQAYAKSGKIHYVLASSGMSGQSGATTTASQILTWVKANYKLVTIGGTSFYDLTQPLS